MFSFLVRAQRAMSIGAAVLLVTTAVAISATPRVAQAAECYRNCYGCQRCDPEVPYFIYCCRVCQGIECGCTLFTEGC